MVRPKKEGMVKDHIVPHRMNDAELAVLEQIAQKIGTANPILRVPNRAEVISLLLKLGVQAFEAKHGKIELKREKNKKSGNS
jgi:hypothetical protein